MNIDKSELFMVCNYSRSPIITRSRYENIVFDPSDGTTPTSKPFTFEEIAYMNSSTNVFKIGLLFFEDDKKQELYEALRINDWKNIMTDEQIKDIILHPTMEGLNSFIQIKSAQYFDRIRGMYIHLMNTGYDISSKVSNIIDARYQEIKKNIMNTKLEIVKKDVEDSSAKKIEDLEAQIKALMEKLEQSTSGTSESTEQENKKPATKKKSAKTAQ